MEKYGNGFKRPAGSESSDKTGERMEKKDAGVGMGKMDAVGSDKLFNTGRTSGVCYAHERTEYKKK
jgi:hypothetical protein